MMVFFVWLQVKPTGIVRAIRERHTMIITDKLFYKV